MDASELIAARDGLLETTGRSLAADPAACGIFLAGSLTAGAADAW